MNNFYNKLERKLGKYAISNITFYLICCYGFGYAVQLLFPRLLNFLTLEPGLILRGQIWRIFTWVIIPPGSENLFFVLITLYFYYSVGRSLEHVWGTFKLNLYLFSGMLFTVLGSFILYFILRYVTLAPITVGLGSAFSTYYINMSLFLAYAATFPDMQVYLFMILPIKVKVLGIIYGIILLFNCISGGVLYFVIIGSSLLNFLVFFMTSGLKPRRTMAQRRQHMEFTASARRGTEAAAAITKHKCAVCGRTDKSHQNLEFRFCSKCNGNYEYCQDHLFTHEHIK